jgi:fatty-acyl-CoA synthase
MAAVAAADDVDLTDFRSYLASRLPSYARPVFLRLRDKLDLTGTFKYSKTELALQGYDPAATADRIYFDSPELQKFIPLDQSLYDRIQRAQVRI